MNQVGVWRRLRYSDLKEAACVRGGRYGISIDFGLEVVERETFKSKFIDPTMEPKLTNRLIVTKEVEFFKTAGLESPMPRGSGTRQRPPQSGFVQVIFWEICRRQPLRFLPSDGQPRTYLAAL
jgi:hypothetical protein